MTLKPQTSTSRLVIGVLFASVFLAACQAQPARSTSTTSASPANSTVKQGDTTKSGKVIQSNGKFYLQVGGNLQEIDSYSLSLADYVGKTITATGQFSGDTLFVAKIQPN